MTFPRLELKWAFIYTIFLLVWMCVERFLGWHDEKINEHHLYTLFFYLPAIAIYFIALIDKRNNFYGGIITYKQAFISGLILTVFIAILAIPAQIIISEVISPYYFKNVIEYAVSSGIASPEEAKELFNLKRYLIQSVVSSLTFGFVITAIVSAFIKRK